MAARKMAALNKADFFKNLQIRAAVNIATKVYVGRPGSGRKLNLRCRYLSSLNLTVFRQIRHN